MKNRLFLIIILRTSFLFGQNNEIALTLFKIEKNSETYNTHFESKLITGFNYTRHFNHLQWFSTVEYGEN